MLDVFLDRSFRGLTLAFAWLTIVLMLYLVWEIGGNAAPAMQKYGLSFITSTIWDINKGQFGVLPEIWGTLYSSLLALLLGGFFGVAIAIFLTQDFLPPKAGSGVQKHCRTVSSYSQCGLRPVGHLRAHSCHAANRRMVPRLTSAGCRFLARR